LEAARAERSRLDDALRAAAFPGGAQGLQGLLERLLSRQPGLVLERLRLLDDGPAAPAGAASAAMAAAATPEAMRWQGVELQVQGRWREAQAYLQALERELPGVRWGALRLSPGSAGEAPRWQLQVFLLKVQP
jgi:MSHA biogenesis protein MshJ